MSGDELNLTAESTGIEYSAERARLERLVPSSPGEHVWIVAAAYVVSAQQAELARQGIELVHLDAENLASLSVGCYVCELPYAKRLTFRRCTGDPGPLPG